MSTVNLRRPALSPNHLRERQPSTTSEKVHQQCFILDHKLMGTYHHYYTSEKGKKYYRKCSYIEFMILEGKTWAGGEKEIETHVHVQCTCVDSMGRA